MQRGAVRPCGDNAGELRSSAARAVPSNGCCAPARYTAAALDGGCVPLISGAGSADDSELAQALMDIYNGKRLYLASASSGYYKNRDEFDRSFAAALELFY